MGSVGIHLDKERRTVGEADPESVLIRASQAQLSRPVQDPNTCIFRGQAVGELAGAVRRGVVDDKNVVPEPPDSRHHLLEVLALVVSRQDDEHLGGRSPSRRDAHRLNLTLTTCLNMSNELRIGITLVGAELRHTTGTSTIRTPRRLARNSTSGS